jgi:hypothetical protein
LIDLDALFFASLPDSSHVAIWQDLDRTCQRIAAPPITVSQKLGFPINNPRIVQSGTTATEVTRWP